MRSAVSLGLLIAAAALAPAIAQQGPESLLPPGFGEPAPASDNMVQPLPDNGVAAPEAVETPVETTDSLSNVGDNAIEPIEVYDLPPEARRSLEGVGLLTQADGGFGAATFGAARGEYLTQLMRSIEAPVASRWLSIMMRRVLLSQSATPPTIDGADWVAERTWLLVRMGEADNARLLAQLVDSDNHSAWLREAALQAALASADPAAVCGFADAAAADTRGARWILAQAMCAGLAGEGGTASTFVRQARQQRGARGIDALLAEKVAGAGSGTRRAITIQWDGVDVLTSWRYGLAAATAVPIPVSLFASAGPQVQAWSARAPLFTPAARLIFADRAATLGVFSGAALNDLYGQVWDATDASERGGTFGEGLRATYFGDRAARLSALRTIWTGAGNNALRRYARDILIARPAALIAVDPETSADDRDALIAAMFAGGLDSYAALWGDVAGGDPARRGWALLAVGAPEPSFTIDVAALETATRAAGDAGAHKSRLLSAGLAGLGRLPDADIAGLAESQGLRLDADSSWTRALDRAVAAREVGTVVLLCAAGMQTIDWAKVPPAHLYRIVRALREVGLGPAARMVAAEAVART